MPSSRSSEEHEGVWAVETQLHPPVVGPMLAAHLYNIHCVTDMSCFCKNENTHQDMCPVCTQYQLPQ